MSYEFPNAAQAWRELQEAYGKYSIREIMGSGDSGVALPVLVSARAAFQMLTKVDARNFCRLETVPPGGGKVYHIQRFTAHTGDTLTEESTVAVTDIALDDVSATIKIFAIRSDLTDLLQRQAAVNFADAVGRAHGNAMIREVNNDIYVSLNANTSNTVGIAGTGEQKIAWSDVISAMQKVESQRGEPDTLVTSPKKLHELMMRDLASQIFMGAYVDYLRTGRVQTIAGLNVFADPVYKTETWTGTTGEEYAHVLQSDEAIAWAQAWDVSSEIQRYAELVGFKLVTSLSGDSVIVVDEFIASIQHT